MAQYNVQTKKYVDRNNNLFDVFLTADANGNVYPSSDVMNNIQISSGSIPGISYINHLGAAPEIPQNGAGTVWDINGVFYPWNAFDTAHSLNIQTTNTNGSVSTDDNGKTVTVIGLDENYNEISETFTISGSTANGIKLFKRINNVFCSPENLSNINIRINSTIVQRISIGKGRSLSSTFTIPAGYTGYLTQGTTSCASGADATVDMYVRPFGNGFFIGHTLEVSGTGGQYIYPFTIPLKITEKSDIDVRASVRTNKARVTASYDLILVQNS